MDAVTWGALTLTLTLLGATWTWWAFRHRGVASGLRGAGLTLLPAAAWMTGTMEMFTEIGGSVLDWATSLVFSPIVWAGIVLAGMSVLLLGASGMLREHGRGGKPAAREDGSRRARGSAGSAERPAVGQAPPPKGGPVLSDDRGDDLDDDMADIEAILRKRGIT